MDTNYIKVYIIKQNLNSNHNSICPFSQLRGHIVALDEKTTKAILAFV